MGSLHAVQAGIGRLRFVFDGSVLSFDLATGSTFGDVARRLGRLSRRRYGAPVSVEVMLWPIATKAVGDGPFQPDRAPRLPTGGRRMPSWTEPAGQPTA